MTPRGSESVRVLDETEACSWSCERGDPGPFTLARATLPCQPLPAVSRINHLRYIGFSFYVMPVNFVIHAAHPKSVAKTVWEKVGGGKQVK